MFPCVLPVGRGWTNAKRGAAKGLKADNEWRPEVRKPSCWVPAQLPWIRGAEGLLYVTAINPPNGGTHRYVLAKRSLADLWEEAPRSSPTRCLCQ